MAFLAACPCYDIYSELSKFTKYETFMKDVNDFISPYHYDKRPLKTFRKHAEDAGFVVQHLEIRNQVFHYTNEHELKGKSRVRCIYRI